MRRSAPILTLCSVIIFTCGGCGIFGKKKAETYTADKSGDPYAAPAYESSPSGYEATSRNYDSTATTYDSSRSYGNSSRNYDNTAQDRNTYATSSPMTPIESTYSAPKSTAATVSGAPRYHVVSKGDTLYAIARMYYGDQRKWRDVYEANRSDLSDPNMIRTGQRLVIP